MDQKTSPFNGNTQLLLQEIYVEIGLDRQHGVVIAKWKGTLSLEEVRHGCELITAVVKEHGLTKHLSDHTILKKLAPEVQAYLAQSWFREVESVGLRKLAVRLAMDIFAQATVRRVNTLEQYGKLHIEVFPSCEEAYEWLKN